VIGDILCLLHFKVLTENAMRIGDLAYNTNTAKMMLTTCLKDAKIREQYMHYLIMPNCKLYRLSIQSDFCHTKIRY
jgi:hypothetical protein